MQIVFLGNFSVPYCSEVHHAKSLELLGHIVTKLQEGKTTGQRVAQAASHSDLFIWVHTHGWKTPGMPMKQVLSELKRRNIPSLTYHLDLWFGLKRQSDIKKDDVWSIEHFFTVDNLMAAWLNENGVRGHYLQAGVFDQEAYIHHAYNTGYDNEVIFVGSKGYHSEWEYRPKLINWLGDTYKERFKLYGGDGLGVIRGDKLNELYAKTKVVVGDSLCINYNYPDYWSDRVYETLGRGGFIIFPRIQGMESHFQDKKHLVFYNFGDFDQLKGLIDYYLEHNEEREEIRLAGHLLVKENHTYKHRWEHILKTIF